MDPGAFLEFGDGIIVPGNRNLSQSGKDMRAGSIYWPYHDAIDDHEDMVDVVRDEDAGVA